MLTRSEIFHFKEEDSSKVWGEKIVCVWGGGWGVGGWVCGGGWVMHVGMCVISIRLLMCDCSLEQYRRVLEHRKCLATLRS